MHPHERFKNIAAEGAREERALQRRCQPKPSSSKRTPRERLDKAMKNYGDKCGVDALVVVLESKLQQVKEVLDGN